MFWTRESALSARKAARQAHQCPRTAVVRRSFLCWSASLAGARASGTKCEFYPILGCDRIQSDKMHIEGGNKGNLQASDGPTLIPFQLRAPIHQNPSFHGAYPKRKQIPSPLACRKLCCRHKCDDPFPCECSTRREHSSFS